ncbi:MAG: nucleoside diphosphate kinase regulator [Syntrophales bacterium]|jgi:regulator of nucleoside diphosphate kinase|nr:nucleoside diphosphate kinase regulator [Syntrophales bacterium]MDD4339021.1 nucleoside diphosphate kinase regulator [Syntrophales bacterium]HOG06851.1 nucleoside diphosphate kinase regulator [Syntrophales bacterium]HPB69837.1 nucleoside diphosphate kinase regulator [Syntrophales bacterium]HQN26769.1 nucleoside diphosphate kinase regulator [Syntrophales bacterium]
MAERPVYMTSFDMERLESLIQTHRSSSPKRKAQIDRLEKELDRAVIVDPKDIPADVVTMNTKLRLRDETSGEEMVLSLVFPADANLEKNRVSVLAPIGTALLGYRVGDIIEWEVPSGTKTFRITETLYQPEASGHYDV